MRLGTDNLRIEHVPFGLLRAHSGAGTAALAKQVGVKRSETARGITGLTLERPGRTCGPGAMLDRQRHVGGGVEEVHCFGANG